MYEFHYDYITNKYDNKSKLLFTDTDSVMYEIKTKDIYEDFSSNKEMFDFSNYSTKSKCHDDSNKSVNGKDKTAGVAIEEFVELKPKMYSFLVDNNEHKKAKSGNKNVLVTISYNEYKDVLLINKCIRHSMDRIQSKDYRIGTYEINEISLSCFDDKIYIQNNGYDGLALGYLSGKLFKFSVQSGQVFCRVNCFNFQSNQDSIFVKHTKFEKRKALKKKLNEELMPVAWHPNRWWDWCVSENEKKEIEPIFTE